MGAIETTTDYQKDLTVFKASGTLSADEFRDSMIRFYEGKITSLVLWEISDADLSKISNESIHALARQTKQTTQKRIGGKTAFVFNASFDFGLGRMFEAYTEIERMPFEIRAFQNIDEAKEWLGV